MDEPDPENKSPCSALPAWLICPTSNETSLWIADLKRRMKAHKNQHKLLTEYGRLIENSPSDYRFVKVADLLKETKLNVDELNSARALLNEKSYGLVNDAQQSGSPDSATKEAVLCKPWIALLLYTTNAGQDYFVCSREANEKAQQLPRGLLDYLFPHSASHDQPSSPPSNPKVDEDPLRALADRFLSSVSKLECDDMALRVRVRDRILESTTDALGEIREVRLKKQNLGLQEYQNKVKSLLDSQCILAVCGKKGLADESSRLKYFEMFYEFAEKRKPMTGTAPITVCRIFIEDEENRGEIEATIGEHRDRHASGVAAITVKLAGLTALPKADREIAASLRTGSGFLLFVKQHPNRTVALIHEGAAGELVFTELRAPPSVYELMSLWRSLCEQSDEYLGQDSFVALKGGQVGPTKKQLDEFLVRVFGGF
ncbi:hypothetical protein RAS2_05960 [Phycisphaerae bacterium RAS2]|nr:hypothetical protein RAS2_05960 [Phycisphaerae bacterium RAS2]